MEWLICIPIAFFLVMALSPTFEASEALRPDAFAARVSELGALEHEIELDLIRFEELAQKVSATRRLSVQEIADFLSLLGDEKIRVSLEEDRLSVFDALAPCLRAQLNDRVPSIG